MTSPGGEFIRGLLGGFQGGYGMRSDMVDAKRRRELEDENLRFQRQRRERLAFENQREDAEFTDRTGIGYVPPSALRLDFTAPTMDASRLRSSVGQALMGPLGSNNVGQVTSAPEVDFGGFRKVGPSATERAEGLEGDRAAAVGRALAGIVPGLSDLSPEQQTMVGAGMIPLAAVGRASEATDLAREAAEFRQMYPRQIGAGTPDGMAVRMGRYLFQQRNDMRPATQGGNPPGSVRPLAEWPASEVRAAYNAALNDPDGDVEIIAALRDEMRRRTVGGRAEPATSGGPRRPAVDLFSDSLNSAPGGSGSRQVITADQRDYLMSIGQWNPSRYEVR